MLTATVIGILKFLLASELNECKVVMDTSTAGANFRKIECVNGEMMISQFKTGKYLSSDTLKIIQESKYTFKNIHISIDPSQQLPNTQINDTIIFDIRNGAIYRSGKSKANFASHPSTIQNSWNDTVKVWNGEVNASGLRENQHYQMSHWGSGFEASGKAANNESTYTYKNTLGNLELYKVIQGDQIKIECYMGDVNCHKKVTGR